jgi:hypothetical protein
VPTWRFSVGRKGVSRITVFERPDASSLFVEWWADDGRHKQALSNAIGEPVTDKGLAMDIAREMSARQERKRNQNAAELLGIPTERTLTDLLETLHENRGPTWSENHTRGQGSMRKFWLDKLGDVRLTRVTAAVVERIVQETGKAKSWSVRTRGAHLRYIIDAFYYAERKLKWIEPRHNLSAVEMPRAKVSPEAYTLDEAKKLVPALEAIDWRAGWIAEVAVQTGRRLNAIRTLPERKGWVTLHDGYAVLQFPADTDKTRNTGQAVIAGRRALRLTARALEDWSVPTLRQCWLWMFKAEKASNVEHKKSRSWHGFKRLYATITDGQLGRGKQSGTRELTLDRIYKQDVLGPKVELAKILAGQLAGR